MKADLHSHLLIGFQPEWLRVQGYSDRNLAKLLVDPALRKDMGLVAVTSENFEIPKGSVHDRFARICEDAEKLMEKDRSYSSKKIGENILKVVKSGGVFGANKDIQYPIYIVNGQTVIIIENGKRYDHLVIGSNQVPNNRDFDYTMKYLRDNGLLSFLEHAPLESHCGVGISKAEELLDKYGDIITGIEGHNASMTWHERFSKAHLIGKFNRGVNRKSKELAKKVRKPYIATSDAHSPEQIGAGNIEFLSPIPFSEESEAEFFLGIREDIERGEYKCNEGYVSRASWIKNATLFILGTKLRGIA